MTQPLLSVRDLTVKFHTEEGVATAVDRISFDVAAETVVALVGESGCGKSATAHAIMRLLPTPPARVRGAISFEGVDVLELPPGRMRALRGKRVAMVFQDPTSSLNPVFTIGSQLAETLRLHEPVSRSGARKQAVALLERVGMPEPAERAGDYPHELSGGMRQRVMIAMAIACNPSLIIADEPTTALDMLAAARINALLADLRRERKMSLLLISHDLAMVGEIAERVIVLYAGRIVEEGPTEEILGAPRHPYTETMLKSVPPLRHARRRRRKTPTRLPTVGGTLPDPRRLPTACRFADRCPSVFDRCREEEPELYAVGEGHQSRCFLVLEEQQD